jgi:hypothetical protein
VGRALGRLAAALAQDRRAVAAQMAVHQERFREYSPYNRILIAWQRPDATFVKGRGQWRKEDCRVRKGARAIAVLAPALAAGARGPTRRFRWTSVYDVRDVEGPVPEAPRWPEPVAPPARLAGLERALLDWASAAGCRLIEGTPEVNLVCDGATDGYHIWMRPGLTSAGRCAVLAHEAAHVRLHFKSRWLGPGILEVDSPWQRPPGVRELQAELTAFLVLAMRGVDLSEGAAAYLQAWAADRRALDAELPACLRAAAGMAAEIEGRVPVRPVRGPRAAPPGPSPTPRDGAGFRMGGRGAGGGVRPGAAAPARVPAASPRRASRGRARPRVPSSRRRALRPGRGSAVPASPRAARRRG